MPSRFINASRFYHRVGRRHARPRTFLWLIPHGSARRCPTLLLLLLLRRFAIYFGSIFVQHFRPILGFHLGLGRRRFVGWRYPYGHDQLTGSLAFKHAARGW